MRRSVFLTMIYVLSLVQNKIIILIKYAIFQRNKAPNEQAIPLLMPQHHMVIPHYMGRSQEVQIKSENVDNHKEIKRQDSFSSRSSLQDIPLLLPQEADDLDTPNGDPKSIVLDSPPDLLDQPSKLSNRLGFTFRKSKIEPVGPDMPMRDFVDDLDTLAHHGMLTSDGVRKPSLKSSDPEWWETQERGNQVGFTDESGQVGPCTSCRCQVGITLIFFCNLLNISQMAALPWCLGEFH